VKISKLKEPSSDDDHSSNVPEEGSRCDVRRLDRTLTISEAAELLGVSYATVRRLMETGCIVHERPSPNRIVTRESHLVAYVASITVASRPA
jgi:excisionase family DNA binding protein